MKRFLYFALLGAALFGFLVIIVVFLGLRTPVEIACVNPGGCDEIGSFMVLDFELSRPIDPQTLQDSWYIEPEMQGEWVWINDQNARWMAFGPLEPGLTVRFGFRAAHQNDFVGKITWDNHWKSIVRPPVLLFISKQTGHNQLYRFDPFSKTIDSLLAQEFGMRLNGYRPSPDGERIALAVTNNQMGVDLWMLDRANRLTMILDCGPDRCLTPDWSRAHLLLAYTREILNGEDERIAGPQPWILDLVSGETYALLDQPLHAGYTPIWSPDDEWIAFWNGGAEGVQVVNIASGDSFLLPSSSGDSGCWSADGKSLYYADVIRDETSFTSAIHKANVESHEVINLTGIYPELSGYSFTHPVCHPQGNGLLVTVQANKNLPGRELWWLDNDGKRIEVISDDLTLLIPSFSFSPDGRYAVFLAKNYTELEKGFDVFLWEVGGAGMPTPIAEASSDASWLP